MNYEKLSDEELIKEFRAGDEEAFSTLVKRYKFLVSTVSRSFFLIGAEQEDLIQEGMIGLMKACKNYSSANRTSFKTFAYLCIKRQIQSAVKAANRTKNQFLNNYISLNPQGGITVSSEDSEEDDAMFILPSPIKAPDDKLIDKENFLEITKKIKSALSQHELRVLALYLKGMSYSQIAEIIGKNVKSVDNSLTKIKSKLQFLKLEH